jgi:5-formaminoimidazole-4-carboxamide-1-beta-D-ribofuranosyl 5'-monophosphate synthetase
MKKILFCVMFTSQEDWDSPSVVFVNATDRDKAYFAALKKIGFTEEEADEMKEQGHHDDVIIVVEDIIDEDYEPTEET